MIILNKPTSKSYLSRSDAPSSAALVNKFFDYGRIASVQLLNDLELKNCSVSLPAYICGSLPKFLEDTGYKVNFYDVLDLNHINLKDIETHVKKKKPKAFFVCHYFGLNISNIQEIREFADFSNIELIEDYCHSYESFHIEKCNNRNIKNAVFSFRKTLPFLLGAGYYSQSLSKDANFNNKSLNTTRHAIVEKAVNRLGWPNIYSDKFKIILDNLIKFRSIKKIDFSIGQLEKSIDSNALNYLNESYISWSAKIRIKNHNILYNLLTVDNNKFIVPTDICVPQVFVILDESEKLCIFLRNRGIGAYKWPEKDTHPETINKSLFNGTYELSRKITCIPIHQDVSDIELRYIAKQINIFYKSI